MAAVQLVPTPNPNAHKYVLPEVRFAQPLNLSSAAGAAAHPLAARLFAVEGVYNVLLARDFVTVNKRPDVAWEAVDPAALEAITNWLNEQP